MKKERKTIKELIVNWLGIENELELTRYKLKAVMEDTKELLEKVEDIEYSLDEKADAYQVDNLESDVSDCVEEWRVDDMIQTAIDDTEIPTREDIQEIVIEEQHEILLDMVKNNIDEIQQKQFENNSKTIVVSTICCLLYIYIECIINRSYILCK